MSILKNSRCSHKYTISLLQSIFDIIVLNIINFNLIIGAKQQFVFCIDA